MLFTSLNGRTFERLEGICEAAYKRWEGTEWWNHSYEKLWQSTQELKEENGDEVEEGECHVTKEVETKKKGTQPQRAPRESVVYLTADSDFELSELIQGETYIIGGICDHNRYKVS